MKLLKAALTTLTLTVAASGNTFAASDAADQAAANFPTRPITLMIGFPPGGGADAVARFLADAMSDYFGQSVIVENKPGADSIIATAALAKAPKDGYTIMMTMSPHVTNPVLHEKLTFDVLKDFAPISRIGTLPMVLVANTDFPPNSVAELIDYVKKSKDPIYYGSPGPASTHFLAMELLKDKTGIDMIHVPYKGGGPAMIDLLGGRISLMFGSAVQTIPFIREHRLKALGIATPVRDPLLPDVPTISESGAPGYEVELWYGMIAPAGTPAPIIAKLNKAIHAALESETTGKKLAEQGLISTPTSPEKFGEMISTEYQYWKETIPRLGISIN